MDSILIDEARTPLIISGQAEDRTEVYHRMDQVPPLLERQKEEKKQDQPDPPGDFFVDEKNHQIVLSEAGHQKAEEILARIGMLPQGASLYEPAYINLFHHLNAALRAHHLFHRDQHYVVQDGEVIIVDEFTGRLMQGRRWSDGLHQAVEAKEKVAIQNENQTLASITFQNYFRMYGKLAGMTGTADTEAYEFQQIYGLETVVIPTNVPMIRDDRLDQVYRTAKEKYLAVIKDIQDCQARGQPVLVGTTSIENSELISGLLSKEKLAHQVLNAKQHAREAEIVAQAGRPKMITIATNMAGRGTDIVLGGNVEKQCDFILADEKIPEEEKKARVDKLRSEWQSLHDAVVKAGGLHIIGTERHESRRVDNQLRGRSGRQGDPGSSRFYMSLEDALLRIFAGERINRIMVMLKMPEGEAIEHRMVTRSIESAQRKVEARNFDIRKQLLEYDDVANDQRKTIYALRNEVLESQDVSPRVDDLRAGVIGDMFRVHVPEDSVEEQWDVAGLEGALKAELNLSLPLRKWLEDEPELGDAALLERIVERAERRLPREGAVGRGVSVPPVRALRDAADPRRALARAPGGARPPAPGHPPARLRAEEPEAGVQARGLRAVRRDGRGGQARGGQDADRGRDPRQGRRAAGRRQGARAERPAAARRAMAGGEGEAAPEREEGAADGAPRREGRPQRSLPLRFRQEIQALPRQADLARRGRSGRDV